MAKAKIALLYERLSRDEDDLEDKINTIIDGRKMVKNASYFAFTATPKNKTLEMFGKKKRLPDGTTKPEPHYVYTMNKNPPAKLVVFLMRAKPYGTGSVSRRMTA